MRESRSEFLDVHGLQYHIRHWGDDGAPKLFLVHGWMDMSASFQFVVDCLAGDWHVIAPDLRGFGLSARTSAHTYWYPDYLADLDFLLDHYSRDVPVNLAGHSMGGNIVSWYAGLRPHRIRRLVNMEGFGLADANPDKAPQRYVKWLDEIKVPPTMSTYASRDAVAKRLQQNNRRLSDDKAAFLALHWSQQRADGHWEILGDPLHKAINPMPFRLAEMAAAWRCVTAPVLWVESSDLDILKLLQMGGVMDRAELDRRIACFATIRTMTVPDSGHMLHHDQPAVVAGAIEQFLA